MNFNRHYNLEGKHAFMSPSSPYWLNYTPEKLKERYYTSQAAEHGTIMHAFAADCIKLNQRLPKSKKTLNMYVNDAIGYGMTPEVVLYYSDYCFGTVDTICFRDNYLRVHDYKSGDTPAKMEQLLVYAALFCLEYGINPEEIDIELRIYQHNEIDICEPVPEKIREVMKTIVNFDRIIQKLKSEEDSP